VLEQQIPFSKLHVEVEGLYKSNVWFGKSFVDHSAYHFDRARVGISGTSDLGEFGAGIHFQVRNNTNTNYLHAIIGQNRNGSLIFENILYYPNPIDDGIFYVDLGNSLNQYENISIVVTDLMRRPVFNLNKVTQRIVEINLKSQTPSVYLLHVLNGNIKIMSKKIIYN